MTTDELSTHIFYVSGHRSTSANWTSARAVADILLASGLVEQADVRVTVAPPSRETPHQTQGNESEETNVESGPIAGASIEESVPRSMPSQA